MDNRIYLKQPKTKIVLRDFYIGPYVHLVVSAFAGGIGYINCQLLPPFLRVDEICQLPHQPIAEAADIR